MPRAPKAAPEEKVEAAPDTSAVIKTTDLAEPKIPTSFIDLEQQQLAEAARWFGAEDTGDRNDIIASLDEWGVTWDMYAREFKVPGYENIPAPEAVEPRKVDLEDAPDAEVEEVEEIVAAPPVALAPAQKYLIRFIGENPYFERGKYKFTQERPFVVMPAADAQEVLVAEPEKFRQAFPAELESFFDGA